LFTEGETRADVERRVQSLVAMMRLLNEREKAFARAEALKTSGNE